MTDPIPTPKKTPAAKTNSFTTVTEASTASQAARADAGSDAQASSSSGGTAAKMTEKAKAEASKLADQARAAADDRVESVKSDAVDRIDETAQNIRSAGREFGADSYQAQAADYLADNLIEAADRIRAQDLDSVAREMTDFARRNPAVVLGGAALLGFAAARLLKASEHGGRA